MPMGKGYKAVSAKKGVKAMKKAKPAKRMSFSEKFEKAKRKVFGLEPKD